MNISSNKKLTINYLMFNPENFYFDRKRGKISSQDLANEIASFANANGGDIVVGITDDGKIEGFNSYGISKLNDIQKVVTGFLNPSPICEYELVNIKNYKDEDDIILIFHVEPANNFIVRNNKDEVYIRQGDSSIKLSSDQIRSLEYDKKQRDFESELLMDSSTEDIDSEIVNIYKKKIGTNLSNEHVLKARGFLCEKNGKLHLTKAGMLLFGKNPSVYLPGARVRVIKFEGTNFQFGENMNIVKDKIFDKCLYRVLEQSKDFIISQLRDFTHLNSCGIFETITEYP